MGIERSGAWDEAGTGLGLAISRSYAPLLGKKLDAESNLGADNNFTLCLPLRSAKSFLPPVNAFGISLLFFMDSVILAMYMNKVTESLNKLRKI